MSDASITKGDGWETVSKIARRLGLEAREVERVAISTGLSTSKVSTRDSAQGLEYRPGAVKLIERELRALREQAERRAG